MLGERDWAMVRRRFQCRAMEDVFQLFEGVVDGVDSVQLGGRDRRLLHVVWLVDRMHFARGDDEGFQEMEVVVVVVARVFHGAEVDPIFRFLHAVEVTREDRGVGVLSGRVLADKLDGVSSFCAAFVARVEKDIENTQGAKLWVL